MSHPIPTGHVRIPDAILGRSDLAASSRIVLGVLFDMQGHNQNAFPRIKTLSRRTGLSRRSVERAIAQLEEKGELCVWRQREHGKASLYRVAKADEYRIAAYRPRENHPPPSGTDGQSGGPLRQNDAPPHGEMTGGVRQNDVGVTSQGTSQEEPVFASPPPFSWSLEGNNCIDAYRNEEDWPDPPYEPDDWWLDGEHALSLYFETSVAAGMEPPLAYGGILDAVAEDLARHCNEVADAWTMTSDEDESYAPMNVLRWYLIGEWPNTIGYSLYTEPMKAIDAGRRLDSPYRRGAESEAALAITKAVIAVFDADDEDEDDRADEEAA